MKLNKTGQLLAASALSLAAAGFLCACSTLTQDFVFVSSAKAAGTNNYGEMDVFEVNRESGQMRQIPTSPFPSGGRNPVAEATSSDDTNLYVINRDDNTIVQFVIGNDGKLYPQNTTNTPGIFPIGVAVANGNLGDNLFVIDTYQPLPQCSTLSPCTGSIAMYPVTVSKDSTTNGALGSPAVNTTLSSNYWPLTLPSATKDIILPVAVAANGNFVYVAAYDTTSGVGYVFSFEVVQAPWNGTTITTLEPVNHGVLNNNVPVSAGIYPSAITTDPTGAYVYVTDSSSSNILGFASNSGNLTTLSGSPYQAGNKPSAIVVDATGKFAYVANAQDSTIGAYSISSGVLAQIYLDSAHTQPAISTTGTQPVAIGIDPSLNEYLYTANFLAGTVSGFQIQSDGSLINSKGITYQANANPTAVAAIPHQTPSKSQ